MVVKVVSKLPSKSAARQAQYSRQLRAEMRRVKSRKRVGHLSLLEKYLRAKSAALGQSAAPTESSAPAKSPAPSTLSGSPTPDTSSAPTAANTPSGPTSSESKSIRLGLGQQPAGSVVKDSATSSSSVKLGQGQQPVGSALKNSVSEAPTR